MKKINILTLSFLVQMLSGALLFDVPIELTQPDGEILPCLISGDEFYNRLHDSDGYTIVQSPTDGFYYYATLENEQIVPSPYRADIPHNLEAMGINKNIMIPKEQYQRKREQKSSGFETRTAPTIGTVNNLNVFIRFADEDEFTLARSYYDSYFNDPEGPSMLHYFKEVSYDTLTVNTIHYPTADMTTNLSYQDQHPRSYYQPYNEVTNPNGYTNDNEAGIREQTLLLNAIAFIEDEVPDTLDIDANNDGYVDNVTFLVSGTPGAWASLLWPHRWVLYMVEAYIDGKRVWDYNFNLSSGPYFSVGTLCHEFAHSLGAPDLYHYWDTYSPVAVGGWDLMDASTDIPQYVSSYIKYRYFDWIDLEDASGGGTFSLDPVTSPHNCAYKLESSNPMEYFVLEYRTQEGIYDTYAPGIDQGIVIYRVNDLYNGQGNANGPPDELYVYRVGGTPTSSGSFGAAVFNSLVGRTEFNDNTDPSSFLSDGSSAGINVVDIGEPGDTIEFTILNLMLLGNFMGTSHDLDGDGVINPGESVLLEFEMNNMSDDVFANSVTGYLSSDSDIIFPYPEIDFGELGPGVSTSPYIVEAFIGNDIELGDALITMNITAEYQQGGNFVEYDGSYSFTINVSLNQSGFPYEISFPISSSPIEINIDNHPDNELIFGDYDGFIRAFKSNGTEIVSETYPYETGNQIWGSPASADMDLDGVIDYVIASKDKSVYLLDQNGFKGSADLETFLLGTPTIGNIDDDDELELIVGGYSSSGEKIYALNHDLTPVNGFPVEIDEKIKMGVSLADFNGNGREDIVFGTNDDNIYLLLDDGTIAEGFPFQTGNKIHSSPAILDLDGELVILAGSNDDFLYAINSDGSLRFSVQASDAVEGSPSFLNFMNQCYIFFGDKSGMVYGIDTEGNMLPNFPFDGGSQIIGSIVFSDLNSDTFPEIIFGTDSGEMYVINLDGELYPQMPISFPFPFYSSPLISDIDEDGDMEIIAGTSLSINAYDIKQPGTNDGYWSMYKGNSKRTGVHQFSPPCAMGDINSDQNVDVMDIVQLVNIIIGDITPTAEEVCASDINYDTEIDLLDVIVLLNVVLDN